MVLISSLRSCLPDKILSSPLNTKAEDSNSATNTSEMAVIEFRDPFSSKGASLSNVNNNEDKFLPPNEQKFSGSVISRSSSDYAVPQAYEGPASDSESNIDTPITNFPKNYQLLKTLLLKRLGININNEKSIFELQNYKKNKSQVKITVFNSSDTVYLPLEKISCKQLRFLPGTTFDNLDCAARYNIMNPFLLDGIPSSYLSPSLDDYEDGDFSNNSYNPEQSDLPGLEQDKANKSENSTSSHTFVVSLSSPGNGSEMPFSQFQFKLSLSCKLSTHDHKNSQDSEIKKDRFFDEFAVSELVQNIELDQFNYFIPSQNGHNYPRNSMRFDSIYSNTTSGSEIRSINSCDSKTSSVFSNEEVVKILLNKEDGSDGMSKVIFGKNSSLPIRTFYKDSALNRNVSQKTDKNKSIERLPAGDYIFVIPVRFDSSVPETIVVPNGNLQCNVSVSYDQLSNYVPFHKKGKDSFNNIIQRIMSGGSNNDIDVKSNTDIETFRSRKNSKNYEAQSTSIKNTDRDITKVDESQQYTQIKNFFNLPLIRGSPPADFEFNKSIIINKTFRNYFDYDIFIPRKYIPLNTEIPITIRFAPFMKEIQITSVKVSVVERIYYKKRNSDNYFLRTFTVPLASLRNEETGSTALREYVFDNGNLKNASYPYGINLDKEIVMKLPVFFSGIDSSGSQFCKDPKVKVSVMKKLIHSLGMTNSENYYPNDEENAISEQGLQTDENSLRNNNISKTSERRLSNASRSIYKSKVSNNSFGNVIISKEEEENQRLPLDYQIQKKGMDLLKQEALISKASIEYGDEEYSSRRRVCKGEDGQINFEYLNESIPTLHPDSISFESIKVNHSLQVCIKASHCKKVENADSKRKKNKEKQTKHTKYAVFIDTGIVLMSSLCENDNIQLPEYKAQDEMSMLTNRNEMVHFREQHGNNNCKCELPDSKGSKSRSTSCSNCSAIFAKKNQSTDVEDYCDFDSDFDLPVYDDIV